MIKNYIQLFNKYKTNNDIVSFGTEVKNLNEYIDYIKLFKIRVLSPIKHSFEIKENHLLKYYFGFQAQ